MDARYFRINLHLQCARPGQCAEIARFEILFLRCAHLLNEVEKLSWCHNADVLICACARAVPVRVIDCYYNLLIIIYLGRFGLEIRRRFY